MCQFEPKQAQMSLHLLKCSKMASREPKGVQVLPQMRQQKFKSAQVSLKRNN